MEALTEAHQRKEPFFLVADSYDPHEPWDPPKEYVDLYDEGYEGKEPLNDNYGKDDYLTDRQLLRMRALYAAEVTMADRWLGNFLHKAHEHKIMENTLLVVVSDHGHALGEQGVTGKPPLRALVGTHRHSLFREAPRR
jgi:arylsulfatase A-like enzyme